MGLECPTDRLVRSILTSPDFPSCTNSSKYASGCTRNHYCKFVARVAVLEICCAANSDVLIYKLLQP